MSKEKEIKVDFDAILKKDLQKKKAIKDNKVVVK
jgi:hypothetical protein